jgi:hypothetical protein
MNPAQRFVTVFAGPSFEAGMVRSLLERHGIAAHPDDENIGTVAPHLAAGGGAGAVKVLVAQNNVERARTLLARRSDAR